MFVGRAGIGSLIASADRQEFCQPPLDPSQSLMACNGPGPPGVRRMALRLRDGKCSIASVADPASIEGLEVLRHVVFQALPLHGNGKLVLRAYDPEAPAAPEGEAVAVGTRITPRPPRRSVRAR